MNKIITKPVLIIFTICFVCQPLFAQQKNQTKQKSKSQQKTENLAHAGPNGIFINLGLEIVSSEFPSNKIVGYKFERKTEKDKSWQQVALVSAPLDYNEFRNRITRYNAMMLDSIPLSQIPLDQLWKDAQKYKRLDSLKYLGNLLIVRLSLGNAFFDSTAGKNIKYSYKVSQVDQAGREITTFTTSEVSYPPELPPGKIVYYSKETYENYVNVSWKIENGIRPAQVDVFRRTDLEGDFIRIHPRRIFSSEKGNMIITFRDTLVNAGETYQYYFSPIDYYQNRGSNSDTVLAAAFNINSLIPPYDIIAVGSDSLGGIQLSWRLDNPKKILSLKIYRSENFEKDFSEIAEVTGSDSIYIDRTAEPMVRYFYYFVMTDAVGDKSPGSAKVFGIYKSTAIPFPPLNLRSDSTKNGAKLIWEKPGPFINFYHVYRKQENDSALSLIANVHSSDSLVTFIDSSSTLHGNKIYLYAVQSETSSGVAGNFSDTIVVKPNIIASLSAPHQLKGYFENSKVFLYWENLFKDDPSIDGYMIYRRDNNSKVKKPIFKVIRDSLISAKENSYVDSTITTGNNYDYAVQAVDIYGNKSPLSSVLNIDIKHEAPPAPGDITAVSSSQGIVISWTAPFSEDIKEFKVYRYERGKKPKILGKINAKQNLEYLDKQAKKEDLFFYYVTSVDKQNSESGPSNEVGIRR